MPEAPGQHAQLATERRRLALRLVITPRCESAPQCHPPQPEERRIRASTAVVHAGGCDIADPPTHSDEPLLPFLFLSGLREALVKATHSLEHAAADHEVRRPRAFDVAIDRPVVGIGDRRALPAAHPPLEALEPRADRPAEDADIRQRASRLQVGIEPPRFGFDVVVDEHQQVPVGGRGAGVPRRVRAAWGAEREVGGVR